MGFWNKMFLCGNLLVLRIVIFLITRATWLGLSMDLNMRLELGMLSLLMCFANLVFLPLQPTHHYLYFNFLILIYLLVNVDGIVVVLR
jgi:hypothetical protein